MFEQEKGNEDDFLQNRIRDFEGLLNEIDLQIELRLKEGERRLSVIREQIADQRYTMRQISVADPRIVNSIRSHIYSAISNLEHEYRSERIQALKDVSSLRIRRQELALEIKGRKRLLDSLN